MHGHGVSLLNIIYAFRTPTTDSIHVPFPNNKCLGALCSKMAISAPTLLALLVLVAALIYQFIIHPIFLSPLSKIPSAHFTTPFSSLWILYIRYTNVENATLLRLHRAKGPILRLGPNEISVNCYEEGLKTIYGGNFDKTEFYPRRFANYGG